MALGGNGRAADAGFLLLARILRLGFLADFLSQTVLVGFLTGVGFQVGIAVMGEMVGVEYQTHRDSVAGRGTLSRPSATALADDGLSAAIIVSVLALNRISPKFPSALIAVAAAIAASRIGISRDTASPSSGPWLAASASGSPMYRWMKSFTAPVAASCFVMIVAQSAATARVYARRHQQELDENDDLIGLSVANASAAFSGTFVVNGSPTQTAMVEELRGAQPTGAGDHGHHGRAGAAFPDPSGAVSPTLCAGSGGVPHRHQAGRSARPREIRRESPGEFTLGGHSPPRW